MATVEQRQKEVDFSQLGEPELTSRDWDEFNEAVELFNSGRFWDSHEAWEAVWRRHPEASRLFFQGLIQTAAGLHQIERNIFHGAEKHLRNALWKLRPFKPHCLNVDVLRLVDDVEHVHRVVTQLGRDRLDTLARELFPKIHWKP